MPDLVGRTLKKRYRIDAFLGRGGMAEVYRAYDTRRHYPVAVKVLREDLAEDWDFVRRFQAEAGSLARLAHQNIVRFYSFEQDGRTAFIVMDLVEGDTLRGRLFEAQGRPMAPAEALTILRQVAAALAYAHAEGIIHRDVKPGNIMLRPDGTALLSDFGISKAVDAATVTAAMPGTPAYMSSEQCSGYRIDVRSDVYSLGVVLYEMLAGRRPFVGRLAPDTATGGTHERVRWEQMHAQPPDPRVANPALTRGIAQVVMQVLAKDPDARYPTVMAFLQAFEKICEPGIPSTTAQQPQRPGSGASPLEPSPPPPTGRSMLRPVLTALGVLTLATCIIASVFLLRAAGLDRRILLAVGTEHAATPTVKNVAAPQSTPAPTALLIAAQPSPEAPSPTATSTSTTTPTVTPTGTSTPTATASSTPLPKRSPTATALSEFRWDTTAPEEAFVDGPQDGASISGPLPIVGWSVDQGSGIARIEIYLDGVFQGEADYGVWRPDLASHSGFTWMLNPQDFGNGSHTLTARYVDKANNFAEVVHTLSFQNAEGQTSAPTPRLEVDKTVNVRSGPGTQYPPVGQLTGGTYVIVGRTKSADWWQIDYNDAPGWVKATVVRAVDTGAVPIERNIPDPPTVTPTATQQRVETPTEYPSQVLPEGSKSVHAGPGDQFPVIGQTDRELYVIRGKSYAAQWWQIDFHGKLGWIPADSGSASLTYGEEGIPVPSGMPPPDVPSLDAYVSSLRFFESGPVLSQTGEIQYTSRFSSAQSRFISFAVILEYPARQQQLGFQFGYAFYDRDGNVINQYSGPVHLPAGSSVKSFAQGWGMSEPGSWKTGQYRVDISVDGMLIASGNFEVYE
jgi:serine/threonine-protein kinase